MARICNLQGSSYISRHWNRDCICTKTTKISALYLSLVKLYTLFHQWLVLSFKLMEELVRIYDMRFVNSWEKNPERKKDLIFFFILLISLNFRRSFSIQSTQIFVLFNEIIFNIYSEFLPMLFQQSPRIITCIIIVNCMTVFLSQTSSNSVQFTPSPSKPMGQFPHW